MVEPYKPIYTVKEAAKVLQTDVERVYEFIRSGKLVAIKIGSVKIRGKDLEKFINRYPEIVSETAS